MPAFTNSLQTNGNWWETLGLNYSGPVNGVKHYYPAHQAALEVLAAHPPIGFVGASPNATLTLAELAQLIDTAVAAANYAAATKRAADSAAREALGRAKIEEAFAASDADTLITAGRWAGMKRGEAVAWCWNLFQYEPHGFVHPGSQLRLEAMKLLEAGGLPEVFGYPERAKELAASGLTPRDYRTHKEALGAKTFTPEDVIRS